MKTISIVWNRKTDELSGICFNQNVNFCQLDNEDLIIYTILVSDRNIKHIENLMIDLLNKNIEESLC